MCDYPHFSLWIPIALAKSYFHNGPNLAQKPLYVVATIRKEAQANIF